MAAILERQHFLARAPRLAPVLARPLLAPSHWGLRPQGLAPVLARLSLAPLVLTLLPAFVAGCGSQDNQDNGVSSKAPAEILAAATSTAQNASSVHLKTSSSAGGLTLALNMVYSKEGASGQLSLLGLSVELVRIGNALYVKGNEAFHRRLGDTLGGRTGAAIAKLANDTWLKGGDGSGPLAQLGEFTDMNSELALILGRRAPVAKGAETTVDGQKTIELKQTAKLYTGTLFIATTGNPYPILERKTGRETGQTTFTD